jgi:DNA gyrase subunit A
MRLQRLTGLERDKIVAEHKQLLETISDLEDILSSPQRVLDILVAELEKVKERFGDDRRTEILDDPNEISIEDLIAEEDVVVTVTRGGYIKRTALTEYRAQKRGGRGKVGMATKTEDEVWKLFVASTHATMLFFTDTGRVFARKVFELPSVAPNARGRAIVNLLALTGDERVETMLPVRDFDPAEEAYLLFATRQGKVKRSRLSEYANIRSNGIRAVAISVGDDLLSVHLTDGKRQVFMGTRQGMGIRFTESDARPMGRVSAGVRGIKLRHNDAVVEVATFDPDDEADILIVSDLGFGKRTPIAEFRIQQRGGYGMMLIRLTEKNGTVAGIRRVHDDDQVLVVSEKGMLIRVNVDEISRIGRATQGVRIIRLNEGDRVVAVARLDEREENEAEPENDE